MSTSTTKSGAMGRILRSVLGVWFTPDKPYDLAMARIAFFGYAVTQEWKQVFWWDPLPDDIAQPPGIMRWLPILPASQLTWLLWAYRIASLLALVGLGYRVAAVVASLGLLYFVGLENCFGKVMHSGNLYVIGALVLACSRADDALSVKAWLAKRGGKSAPLPSGEYRWPVRTIWLIIAGMYCAAGVSKLTHTGWEWAFSDSFRNLLLSHHYTRDPITPLGLWLAQYPELCRWVAAGSLVLELSCPLLLLGGWFTFVFGGGLMALQFGIYLMLGVKFDTMLPVFLTLVPWTWLFTRRLGVFRSDLEKGSQGARP
jgi:hypothetical protein